MNSNKKIICFIYPSSYDENGKTVKMKQVSMPSRTLPYLAALTPDEYQTRIIDERVEGLQRSIDVDLIALTGMLKQIPRAIDIAKEFKDQGKKVIIGGTGVFALQHELENLDCFDSIVIGEAEGIWDEILDDFNKGNLKKTYHGQHLQELKGLPFARFDLLNHKDYRKVINDPRMFPIPIETSRGCPHSCKFCLVTEYFGKKMRYRPVSEVVDEIRYQGGNSIFFTDDNIAVNPDRARELFKALKPLDIHWVGEFDTTIINNPEIIELAAEGGCRSAIIGIESLNKDNLVTVQKYHNIDVPIKELIQYFKKSNINVVCSVIFGMDHDTPESIWETTDFMIENNVEMMIPWILTPLPKTAVYDELKNAGRILHNNYSLYDATNCVIQPSRMEPEELEIVYWRTFKHFYNLRAIIPRCSNRGSLKESLRLFIRELYFRNGVNRHKHPMFY